MSIPNSDQVYYIDRTCFYNEPPEKLFNGYEGHALQPYPAYRHVVADSNLTSEQKERVKKYFGTFCTYVFVPKNEVKFKARQISDNLPVCKGAKSSTKNYKKVEFDKKWWETV